MSQLDHLVHDSLAQQNAQESEEADARDTVAGAPPWMYPDQKLMKQLDDLEDQAMTQHLAQKAGLA